jgi:serine/threonine-protein kinase
VNYGRYEIMKELGRGSMGVVYLARDPNIERLVAVKVLRQDRMGNELFVKRFVKEAKVIGRLSHAHTVTVHDIGEEQGEVYIAMEYIEGTPLADMIKEKRLDVKEVVEFGVQIAETLEYAHKKGVVHRDIKPSNIIVQPDGRIKITDFGIARIEDSNASLQTLAGETIGTPSYMSPEQVLGQTVDGRCDLFSLGVVLYELSTGKRPFGGEGKTLATVFNEIIHITPPDPNIVMGQIPRELSALIMKALQKEPAKRFQCGRELAAALKVCLGGGKREEVATTTPDPSVQRKGMGYVIPLAGAALISIIAGGIFFFSHQKDTSPVKNLYPASESRQASLPEKQSTGLMKPVREQPKAEHKPAPSVPLPAPNIKKAEAPARVMPKAMSKPVPSPVPSGSNTKQAVKPAAKPANEIKPVLPPIAAQERSAAKKAESSAGRLPGDKNAAMPNPVATEMPGKGKPPQQYGGAQLSLPVKSKPLPKFAFLKVRTTPKGAAVYVNGGQRGTSPLTLKLDLGKYRVKLCRAGYRDTECLVSLDRMTEYPLTEKLRPIK